MKKFFIAIVLCVASSASDQKTPSVIDSGNLAVMVHGKRVATESFTMQQGAAGNSVSSRLDFDNGTNKAQQQSELEIGSNGSLRKYTWQEIKPGRARIVAEPQDKTFIVVHQKAAETDTVKDSTHPLDMTVTSIVDDNFYSHIQVLIWRYLAMSCNGQSSCQFATQKLPVFVPHQEMSQLFAISFSGSDTLRLKNGTAETGKYRIQTEAGEMHVWMDGTRMVKLVMLSADVEVTRE